MSDTKQTSNMRRWILLAAAVAIVALLAARLAFGMPRLGNHELLAAKTLWEKNQVPDYEVTIRVSGRQGAVYRVLVREGEAREAWRNDAPLKQVRTFRTWSVPGMFETIGRDVDHAEGNVPVEGVGKLKLFGRFDPQFGYPREYLRVESGASNNDVYWEVLEFTPR